MAVGDYVLTTNDRSIEYSEMGQIDWGYDPTPAIRPSHISSLENKIESLEKMIASLREYAMSLEQQISELQKKVKDQEGRVPENSETPLDNIL